MKSIVIGMSLMLVASVSSAAEYICTANTGKVFDQTNEVIVSGVTVPVDGKQYSFSADGSGKGKGVQISIYNQTGFWNGYTGATAVFVSDVTKPHLYVMTKDMAMIQTSTKEGSILTGNVFDGTRDLMFNLLCEPK